MSNTYKSVNIPKEFESGSGGNGGGGGENGGEIIVNNPPYTMSFNDSDSWILNEDNYSINIPVGVHQRGSNILVQVFETNEDFELVDVFTSLTESGSVTIRVGLNSRFSGKLIIVGV
jgi:hypothetical protein